MLKLKEDGYVYVSDRGIEYELLEGMSIGSERKYTSDIIFIMLNNAEYNVDNNVVGYLFGADIFLEDSRYYEESIKEMVDEFEKRNFGKWGWLIMADLTMTYNAEQVACDFYDWLVQMGYCDVEDEIEDLEDVVRDFQCIQQTAPKLFNLLRSISQ